MLWSRLRMRHELPGPPTPEKLKVMREESSGCDSCLLWHKHCKAECCKTMRFHIKFPTKPRIGQMVHLPIRGGITPDLKWLYELRGGTVKDNVVSFRLTRFYYNHHHGLLMIYRTCDNLTDDFKCKEWASGNRPELCKVDLSKGEGEGYFLTHNCMYKFQVEAKQVVLPRKTP